MKRHMQGLHEADQSGLGQVRDGLFLVRIEKVNYRWNLRKPFYVVRFSVQSPRDFSGHSIVGRLYCTPRALWKLNWFLRDFGYDTELLRRDEVDEKSLAGLRGIIKISCAAVNGTSLLNLDSFAPASQWDELSSSPNVRFVPRSRNDL
jgi:hypothetical protein